MKIKIILVLIIVILFPNCIKTETPTGKVENTNSEYYYDQESYRGYKFEKKYLGEIDLPSGEIIAADPFYIPEDFTSPFTIKVNPGKYKVYIYYANLKDWGKRVAFSRIDFIDKKPDRWEIAKLKVDTLLENEYPVDAGLGSFIDASNRKAFIDEMNEYYKRKPQGNYYEDVFEKEFNDDGSWAIHNLDKSSGQVFIFWSGLGDGSYKSYWGYLKNEIVCMVTDFKLFETE